MITDIRINETRIIYEIWLNPGISRISLSKNLCLNKSTITKIVGKLIDEGLVILAGNADITNRRGRRPIGLYLNNGLGIIIGIEIQTDRWIGTTLTPNGEPIDSFRSDKLPRQYEVLDVMKQALNQMTESQKTFGRRILGAGIGLSGRINPYHGTIISSNPLSIQEPVHVYDILKDNYPFPIFIENDANCCCWNVICRKKVGRKRNFICVLGEFRSNRQGPEDGYSEKTTMAVGLGLVIKDSVLHGSEFSAGEFRSALINHPNPIQFNVSNDEMDLINKDMGIWKRVVTELAKNVAMLVNVLNLNMIKIFGDFVQDEEYLYKTFHDKIKENWLYTTPVRCSIEIEPNRDNSVAIGAAGYFLSRVFSRPDLWEGEETVYPQGIDLLRMSIDANRATLKET